MTPFITFKKIWNDDDVVELTVEVCDGLSRFSNNVYIDINRTSKLIVELSFFREEIQNGLFEFKFGEFGPEYANGGFLARLHFYEPGKLLVSTHQQSDFKNFSKTQVASEAKMYLKTEPILLDNFIEELKTLNSGASDEATFLFVK